MVSFDTFRSALNCPQLEPKYRRRMESVISENICFNSMFYHSTHHLAHFVRTSIPLPLYTSIPLSLPLYLYLSISTSLPIPLYPSLYLCLSLSTSISLAITLDLSLYLSLSLPLYLFLSLPFPLSLSSPVGVLAGSCPIAF